jgi:hypothetical protein
VSSTLYVAMLVGLLLGRFIASQEALILEDDGVLPVVLPDPSARGNGDDRAVSREL